MALNGVLANKRLAVLVGLCSLASLVSCSSAPNEASFSEAAPQDAEMAIAESDAASGEAADLTIPTAGAPTAPQLVKHASIPVELDDVDAAVKVVSGLLGQYQGDLLQLSDQEAQSAGPRRVSIELRVPQENLDVVMDDLREMGTVEYQSISAEDVSTQLVDMQARVRNLRKSEEALLEIMERSGSIAEVLEVSRELSNVREQIERTDAQVKNLQNRVAYSTISLTLVSSRDAAPILSPIGETLGDTWQTATAAVRGLSVAMLQLLLWLLVFSPYLAILLLCLWAGRRYWPRKQKKKSQEVA